MQLTREQIYDAVANDRFLLFGQPKWTLSKKTCNTYEVLIDLMLDEDEKPIPAWQFLPLIEADEELTMLFGTFFLKKAFKSAVQLMKNLDMDLIISLNVLGFQVNRPEFCDAVQELMQQAGILNSQVQFELSEAQPVNETGIKNLRRLREEMGVHLVLGNFGMGHSTVDLLRRVSFDMLELSKSFTADITNSERALKVILAILQLAHVLDLTVCAKGIETAEQLELLEEAGFFKGQGYLIGRPMPFAELEDFVRKYAS